MSAVTPLAASERDVNTGADAKIANDERNFRYPGSPPFRDLDLDRRLFKGRDEEAKKVFHSILSADLFLLYAVSGMGKSSLLNAGVMQPLRDRGCWPVSVRLNDPQLSPVEAIERQISEAAARDSNVELVRTPGLDFDSSSERSLWDVLGSLEVWRDDRLQQLVVVFDQFEELFTLDWDDTVRDGFIAQFGEVVRRHRSAVESEGVGEQRAAVPAPNVKFVLVIREDALGELEALADDVPQLMQNRFRLGGLNEEQAESAIREPAMVADAELNTEPFTYSKDAAEEILRFLQSAEHSSTAGIAEANVAKISVDPSQLQIICQYVERRVLPDKAKPRPGGVVEIEASDLGGEDGLRSILGDFYRRTIGTLPQAAQRSVRELCEKGLISKSERRLSLEQEEIEEEFGASPAVLHHLVDQRLLRVEPRVGSEYYELAHDTLVKPILADRSERRKQRSHRRRRIIGIVAGVVAIVAAVLVASLLLSDGGGESAVPLEPGQTLRESVGEAGAVQLFTIDDRQEPSLILVEPVGSDGEDLNAAVTWTNASKARRQQDHLGRGGAERMVVPGADTKTKSTVAVSSSDTSTGPFDVTISPLEVTPLMVNDGEPDSGSIAGAGDVAVYSVDYRGDSSSEEVASSVEVVVVPKPQPGSEETADRSQASGSSEKPKKTDLGLDVEIEVIDPSGVGGRVDLTPAGEGERTTVGGQDGRYLIVVRGFENSIGPFEITATKVNFTGQVEQADVPVVVELDIGSDQVVVVTPDNDLDPVVEIVDPSGDTSSFVDAAGAGSAEVMLLTGNGPHELRVTGYAGSTGAFNGVTFDAIELSEGNPAQSAAPTGFKVDVDNDQVVVVTPDNDELDPVVEIVDPSGDTSSFVDAAGAGSAEVMLLTGNGPRELRVTGYAGSAGAFTVVTFDAIELSEGNPAQSPAPAGFKVDVGNDEFFNFTAQPGSADSFLDLQVYDPDGSPTGQGARSPSPGQPTSVIIGGGTSGTSLVIVTSDTPSDITATLTATGAVDLAEGEPAGAVASPAVFSVAVGSDEFFDFTAQPGSADSLLTLVVYDPDGFPTLNFARSPSSGQPTSVIIGGRGSLLATPGSSGTPGTYHVTVTSDTPSDITATLTATEAVDLAEGEPAGAVAAPAVFSVAVGSDEFFDFTAQPGSADSLLTLVVYDLDGFPTGAFASSPSSGQPTSVIIGGGIPGTYFVIVASDAPSDITATLTAGSAAAGTVPPPVID